MTKVSDLTATLADLIAQRYRDRVSFSTSIIDDPSGVRIHEIRVRQTAKRSRQEIVMSVVGDTLPRNMTIRYKPGSGKTSVPVSEEAVFTVNGEELTAEGFVFHVFKPWFGHQYF